MGQVLQTTAFAQRGQTIIVQQLYHDSEKAQIIALYFSLCKRLYVTFQSTTPYPMSEWSEDPDYSREPHMEVSTVKTTTLSAIQK